MFSVRRAALRVASCSSRAVAVPRQQVASFAIHVSKANTHPAATLTLSRYFSQTARVAQEEQEDAAVEEATKSAEQDTSTSSRFPPQENSIFISNMTFDATDLHLREAFSQYGEILSINIGRDGRGLSRGFGFISFKDKLSADKAVEQANSSFWHGRRINVQHRQAKTERSSARPFRSEIKDPSTSIYVGNIPYETSDSDLNNLFKELDNVTDVRVAVDRQTGWPRGFAHADFSDQESATRAYEKLSAMSIGGRQLRVDYTQPKRPYEGRRSPRDRDE